MKWKKARNLEKDETILRMERIRYADDIPICFEVASIPQKIIADYSKSEITNSLYRVLEEKSGHKIGAGTNQTITAILASEKIAEYLEVKKGVSVLRYAKLLILMTVPHLNMLVRNM